MSVSLTIVKCFAVISIIIFITMPLIVSAQPILAQGQTIFLTQIHPAPETGPEWVELYNIGLESQDLHGWYIEDQLSTPSTLIILDQIIEPNQTLLIALPTAKLNNSSDGVVLKNEAGVVVDAFSYTSVTTGQSWLRNILAPSSTWSLASPITGYVPPLPASTASPSPPLPPTSPSPVASPTPPATQSPSPSPLTQNVLPVILTITEVLACPSTNEHEWIELYNPNTNPVELNGWKVQDNSGNTRMLTGTTAPQAYVTESWATSLLNNTGDTISLYNPSGSLVDAVEFGACSTDQSFSLYEGTWQSGTPSPSQPNPAHQSSAQIDSPSIEAKPHNPSLIVATTKIDQERGRSKLSASTPSTSQLFPWPALPLPSLAKNLTTMEQVPGMKYSNQLDSAHSIQSEAPQSDTQYLTHQKLLLVGTVSVIIGGLLLSLGGSIVLTKHISAHVRIAT